MKGSHREEHIPEDVIIKRVRCGGHGLMAPMIVVVTARKGQD